MGRKPWSGPKPGASARFPRHFALGSLAAGLSRKKLEPGGLVPCQLPAKPTRTPSLAALPWRAGAEAPPSSEPSNSRGEYRHGPVSFREPVSFEPAGLRRPRGIRARTGSGGRARRWANGLRARAKRSRGELRRDRESRSSRRRDHRALGHQRHSRRAPRSATRVLRGRAIDQGRSVRGHSAVRRRSARPSRDRVARGRRALRHRARRRDRARRDVRVRPPEQAAAGTTISLAFGTRVEISLRRPLRFRSRASTRQALASRLLRRRRHVRGRLLRSVGSGRRLVRGRDGVLRALAWA